MHIVAYLKCSFCTRLSDLRIIVSGPAGKLILKQYACDCCFPDRNFKSYDDEITEAEAKSLVKRWEIAGAEFRVRKE